MPLDFGVTDSPLERLLLSAARSESLETQLSRWHRFAGEPTWLELQALKIMGAVGSWERSRFAHADDVRTAARLAAQADKWTCPGVYLIANPILSGVATRAAPGQWHDARKGESTSDAEIARRSVLFIDVDARRPKGTSATDEEVAHTRRVARSIYDQIATILGNDQPLALGASGNGRADLLALDHLDVAEAGRRHQAILVALAAKYTDEHVEIDRVVHDAKRLIPCWGTTKRKGAPGIPERPHRRSALICSDEVTRVSMADLDRLLDALRRGLADEVQRDIDRALGLKVHRVTPAPTSHQRTRSDDTPFTRANALDVADVLSWLGLMSDDRPICPGCGLSDAGVAIVREGLKCSHSRCAGKGVRDGFRTCVDLVAEKHGVSAREAVIELAERFDFKGFPTDTDRGDTTATENSTPSEDPDWVAHVTEGDDHTSGPAIALLDGPQLAVPLPPLEYLIKEIGLVAGGGAPHQAAGYGYTGKTIAWQSAALSLSSGRSVWGAYAGRTLRRVAHVDMEQGERLTRRRYQRLARGMNVDLSQLRDTLVVAVMPPISLSERCADDWERLMYGRDLILIDSLRAATGGEDENASGIRVGLDMLGGLSERTGCRPFVIHHARKPSDGDSGARYAIRGSSAIYDACDSVYVFSAAKGEPVAVENVKARSHGEPAEPVSLVIEDVDIDGDPKAGLRVLVHGIELVAERREEREAKTERIRTARDVATLRDVLSSFPGLATREIRIRSRLSGVRYTAAVVALGSDIEIREEVCGGKRLTRHYLRGGHCKPEAT